MLRRALIMTAILALVVSVTLAAWFAWDMHRAYARIASGSSVIETLFGYLEYARGGPPAESASGPVVLVIHGSGGGFDQGALIAEAVLGADQAWIAPSRFGYLGSGLPPGASFDQQAHAYAHLLDHLGIRRVAVVAMSHGGPSALLFAALYPDRVASLTLLSCGVASSADASQAEANRKGDALTTVFSYDFLYWAASTFLRGPLIRLMGADDAALSGATPAQRALIDRVITEMNPVAPRATGVAFDNRAALPNERIAAIRAPTLILHARDDGLQLYRNAEFAATHIPGARLVSFERGGHLVIALEQAAVRAEVQAFILGHASLRQALPTIGPSGCPRADVHDHDERTTSCP